MFLKRWNKKYGHVREKLHSCGLTPEQCTIVSETYDFVAAMILDYILVGSFLGITITHLADLIIRLLNALT